MYAHRPLRDEDLQAICSFPQTPEELFYMSPRSEFPLTPDQILSLLENRFDPTVIFEESTGQVVAYANFYEDADGSLWLGNVVVAPSHRGLGAAQKLLRTMMDIAKEKYEMERFYLSCHNTNSRGLVFYHKLGFEPFDVRITALDDDRKMITIQMRLDLV
ncbi:GNAT family N-acetyltransferase [Paenibacillus sp. FSL H8-0457]|uniref:GNAT family N-acetyltransferase n=1 Tax=unclassified Paenibacillus TaxID=185978 RepID=UPI0003E1D4FF|nr:GNAT family N-acetyltransferase [Paenibacillus sp. FSL H8-457]ETT66146.1 GCN5-like N-acetyltransferase [Paenibacillus sp. FSL H8-457]